ncbi:MAG: L,D-transpeptidase [Thermoflexales bacterium]|nr:L,D-transpeptidase [Thermoflexales bacterium]
MSKLFKTAARVLLALLVMGSFSLASVAGVDAGDASAQGWFDDSVGSDDEARDVAPGFRESEIDDTYASLRTLRHERFDEAFAAVPAAARSGRWIEVVLSRQMLYAWQDGRVVMSSRISSGLPRTPTVRGTFRVYVKYVSTRMTGPGYNLPNVPYTMYFYRGYGIHGAYWHNNFGHPMSHGCVNLPVPFSGQLFRWASVGTVVYIH